MKTLWRVLLAILLLFCFSTKALRAQGLRSAQPRPYLGALEMRIAKLTAYPPVSILGRPDVLAGYLLWKDYARNLTVSQVDSIFARMNYSDTLRAFAKYLYIVDDVDPVRFSQWLTSTPSAGYYSCTPARMRNALQQAIERAYPDTLNTALLCSSDIIARIKVLATVDKYDGAAQRTQRAVRVAATFTDVLKGRTAPACFDLFGGSKGNSSLSVATTSIDTATVGTCLQFEYRLDWSRTTVRGSDIWSRDSILVTTAGKEWVQKDSEYVVFLSFADFGADSLYNYLGLLANWGFGKSAGIFPIIAGRVYDPQNQMGAGVNVDADVWINAIRQRITMLSN